MAHESSTVSGESTTGLEAVPTHLLVRELVARVDSIAQGITKSG